MAEYEDVKYLHETQKYYQCQYDHMLKRMKQDAIAMQLDLNDLGDSVHSKQFIYSEESTKQRLAKEKKLQSKFRLDTLMKNIDHEQKKR